MRPAEARQISMARSSAQSECGELSTGTKTSLYGMTPPSAVMGSLNEFRIAGLLTTPSEHQARDTPAHQHPSILARSSYLEPRRAPVATREKPMWSRSRCALAPAPLAKRAVARRARYGQLRNACQGTWRSFCRSVLVAFYLARKVTYAESFRVAITDRALDVRDPLLDWLDARPPQCTGDAPRWARQGNRPECLRAMPWPQHGDERWLFARGMAAHLRHDGGSTQATGRSRCRLSRDALSGR